MDLQETYERFSTDHLLAQRSLGPELAPEAHSVIEQIMISRGVQPPAIPQKAVPTDCKVNPSPSRTRIAINLTLGLAALFLVKCLGHTWLGVLLCLLTCTIEIALWIRRRNMDPEKREADRAARKAETEGLSDLMIAAAKGDIHRVTDLLNYGANPNQQSQIGSTALMYAVKNGHADIVKALLNSGARIDAKTTRGSTVLDLAIQHGHQDITALLRLSSAPEIPQSKPKVDQRVAWSPPGISAPTALLAVMIPPGPVTERQWLEALADRVTQMVMLEPGPAEAAESAAKYLDLPTPESPEATGEYLVMGNWNLKEYLRCSVLDGNPFPAMANSDEDAASAIENSDFWLWVELAKSTVSTSTLD